MSETLSKVISINININSYNTNKSYSCSTSSNTNGKSNINSDSNIKSTINNDRNNNNITLPLTFNELKIFLLFQTVLLKSRLFSASVQFYTNALRLKYQILVKKNGCRTDRTPLPLSRERCNSTNFVAITTLRDYLSVKKELKSFYSF